MRYLQQLWSWLLQRGRLSPAAYRVLTGVALLIVANALWSARDADPISGPVALVLLVVGVVTGGRGVQAWLSAYRQAGSEDTSEPS
jgi:drug/metabolite transporter (DMT)-like permease